MKAPINPNNTYPSECPLSGYKSVVKLTKAWWIQVFAAICAFLIFMKNSRGGDPRLKSGEEPRIRLLYIFRHMRMHTHLHVAAADNIGD